MSLGSFLSSIFTAPGQNAYNGQVQQQSSTSGDAYSLLGQLLPELSQSYQTAAQWEPQRQNDISNLLMQMSPGNTPNLVRQARNQAVANAGVDVGQSSAEGQTGGYSPAFTQGNTTAINDQAANQANAAQNYFYSPEYQMQQGANALSLYNQGQQSPFSNAYQQMTSDVYGQPKVQVGESPLAGIAGVLGDFIPGLGGVASSLSGGGGGSGGSGYATDPYGQAYAPGVSSNNPLAFGGQGF